MAARVFSCAFWLQRLSLLRWCTLTMAQHVFACATPRSLRDGLAGLRLPDTAVYPRFSLLRTSREAGGYACTSAPEGWGLHPHEDGVTRLCSLAACLEVRTSFQPTGHSPDLVVNRRTSDGESSSHRHFLFRQDVWTMFRRQIRRNNLNNIKGLSFYH